MEQTKFDDREEDMEFREHDERRKHIRSERRRRIRRNRMLKILCVEIFVALVIFVGFVTKSRWETGVDEILSKMQKQDSEIQSGRVEIDGTKKEKTGEEKIDEEETSEKKIEEETEEETSEKKTEKENLGEEKTEKEETDEEKTNEETGISDSEREGSANHFVSTPDTAAISSENIISTHAILINESTDTIIASKGADERINPASMTKVLTVLVAAEQIKEEDLDDIFTMTLDITDYVYVNGCSAAGFLDGEKVTVRDLFYGTVLPSGGDAALGLAAYTAGSQEAFVDKMNAKLEELGISDSAHVTNCIGIYDENHYCTVYDMAVIMKAAIQNELCREFLSAHTYTTTPTKQHPDGITISNWFLRRIEDKDTGGEVLCAKTGYITEAGNCAVSYGDFAGGTPYICVTAGSTSSWRCIYDHVEIYNTYISVKKRH